jgi:lysophospholipase L1-like esterase
MRDLHAYCAENDIIYISFSDDPRLTEEMFPDGFHLAQEAMPMFTEMLAEALAVVVE